MFAGKRNGIAQAEPERLIGLHHPELTLGLIGEQHNRLACTAHQRGKMPIRRRNTGTHINHEHNRVGVHNGRFRLRPHPAGQ